MADWIRRLVGVEPVKNIDSKLRNACDTGDMPAVRDLVDKGADVNGKDEDGITPLHFATYMGHIDIVQYLHDKGADVNQASENGMTPLYAAAWEGHIDIVQYLHDKGADVSQATKDGMAPLYAAAREGRIDIVRYLHDKGADVNQAIQSGETPLCTAAYHGRIDVVQFLHDKGADVNQATKNGVTPLSAAASHGHIDIVQYLHDKGADVNQATKNGVTPLYIAALQEHIDIVQYLHDKGADVNQADDRNQTPLDVACYSNRFDVAMILVKAGADPTARSKVPNDFTPDQRAQLVEAWEDYNRVHGPQTEVAATPPEISTAGPITRADEAMDHVKDHEVPRALSADHYAAYERALAHGSLPDNTLKAVFLGDGRVGKTSTVKSLSGKPFDPQEPITDGAEEGTLEIDKFASGAEQEPISRYDRLARHIAMSTVTYPSRESSPQATIADDDDAVTVGESASDGDNDDDSPKQETTTTGKKKGSGAATAVTLAMDRMRDNIVVQGDVEGGGGDDQTVVFRTYDGGGQEVYQWLHNLFLILSQCVCVLVFDLSKLQYEMTVARLKYWINSAHSRAPTAPIFLVGTHGDKFDDSADGSSLTNASDTILDGVPEGIKSFLVRPDYTNNNQRLFVVDNTKFDDEGVKLLRRRMAEVARAQGGFGKHKPARWLMLEEILDAVSRPSVVNASEGGASTPILGSGSFREAVLAFSQDENGHSRGYVTRAEFDDLVSIYCDIDSSSEVDALLALCHDSGLLLHYTEPPDLADLVILRPQWLIDVMCCIISREVVLCSKLPLGTHSDDLREKGLLHSDTLSILWSDYPEDLQDKLRQLMIRFDLMSPIRPDDMNGATSHPQSQGSGANVSGTTTHDEVMIVFPLLPDSPLDPKAWHSQTTDHFFSFKFDFLPFAVYQRFVARLFAIHKDSTNHLPASIYPACMVREAGVYAFRHDSGPCSQFHVAYVATNHSIRVTTTSNCPSVSELMRALQVELASVVKQWWPQGTGTNNNTITLLCKHCDRFDLLWEDVRTVREDACCTNTTCRRKVVASDVEVFGGIMCTATTASTLTSSDGVTAAYTTGTVQRPSSVVYSRQQTTTSSNPLCTTASSSTSTSSSSSTSSPTPSLSTPTSSSSCETRQIPPSPETAGISGIDITMPANTASARELLHQLVLNRNVTPVTTGVSKNDPGLWRFATAIQPSAALVERHTRQYKEFFDVLLKALTTRLEVLKKGNPRLRCLSFDVTEAVAGSVRNGTNVANSDIDVIVVLNNVPGEAITQSLQDSKQQCWPGGAGLIRPAHIIVLTEAFHAAVHSTLRSPSLRNYHLESFAADRKVRSTVTFPDSGLEFDVLPALLGETGEYYLLDGGEGTLIYSDNELSAVRLERRNETCPGLVEMIKVMKVVFKAGNYDVKLASCSFQTAAMKVAAELGPTGWQDTTFSELMRRCLSIILEALRDHSKRLPAPNDPGSDVLDRIRADPSNCAILEGFLTEWMDVPEDELLDKLKAKTAPPLTAAPPEPGRPS